MSIRPDEPQRRRIAAGVSGSGFPVSGWMGFWASWSVGF